MTRTYLGHTQTAANADLDALWDGTRGVVWAALDTDATGAQNRAALIAAIATAQSLGGARITAAAGVYQIAGYSTHSLPVPISGPNYTTANEDLGAHFYIEDGENLYFDMPGVTLQSDETGFEFFLFNGPRNIIFDIGRILTPTAGTVSGLTVDGLNAIAITSASRDGWNFHIPNLHADHCKTALYVFGDPAGPYRMRGVTVGNIRHDWGSYGIALHDNGDDVRIANCVTSYVGRPLFAYGVSSVGGHWHMLQRLGGLSFLIKAYDRDTTDFDVSYHCVNENTSVPAIDFGSEHDNVTQPTPCALRNITVNYDDTGSAASMLGIRWVYQVNGVITSAVSTCIFDGFTIRGQMVLSDGLTTLVQQTPTGRLDISELTLDGAPVSRAIYEAAGFYGVVGDTKTRPVVARGLALEPVTSGATTQYGDTVDHTASTEATSLVIGRYTRTRTAAGVFTTALAHVERVAAFIAGAGSTATKVVGKFFEAQTAGTTNFAFETNNAAIMQGYELHFCTGTPEGAITAPVGSIAIRAGDGTTGSLIYRKDSGTGNTGWVAKL